MPSETAAVAEPVPDVLAGHGAVVRTRRGQTLPLSIDGREAVFVVRTGALMLHVTLPHGLRQVVSVLHPGDVFRGAFAPQAASAHLTAVSRGEVLRFRWSAFRYFAASTPAVQRYYDDRTAEQTARQAIHTTAIGRFDCQQRVATFLTELALRTGARAPNGGLAFELPLSRTDMADYLGLNADTLSRTM